MPNGNGREGKRSRNVSRARGKAAQVRACWCGNTEFVPFGPEYGECRNCGTLVYLKDTPSEELLVRDDETDYYGKKYWLEHQGSSFGYPDIHNRARKDLAERNLHWLKALLKYRLPPAQVVDVGCGHGSFVALMREAGYRASGLELSPWVVAFGQQVFGIQVHCGPVESLEMPDGSLDAIVLMDVLEHLPDPTATMRRCLELLKPAGVMLIQTPCFKEGAGHAALVESKDRFLEMLIPLEHIYLFSRRSVTEFFRRLGAEHLAFEPAIFEHYDMFFAVSRAPLIAHAAEEIESALLATPNGRMALALLDAREFAEQQTKSLSRWIEEARAEAAGLREYQAGAESQIKTLTGWVEEARVEAAQLREHQSDAEPRIQNLTKLVEEARAAEAAAKESLALRDAAQAAEVSAAREANAALLQAAQRQKEAHAAQMAEINGLNRSAVSQIETLTTWVKEAREANAALQKAMEEQEHAHATQMGELNRLHQSAASQIETLTGWVNQSRGALEEQKHAHADQIAELDNLNRNAISQIERLTGWVNEAREANAVLQNELDEQRRARATQNIDLLRQVETLTGWVNEAREASAALQSEVDEQRRAKATQNVDLLRQIETLTGWVNEAREANAALQSEVDEHRTAKATQSVDTLRQIETLTDWVREAREANAALQRAMDEQKAAHAREVGELRDLLARPMLKLALRLSNGRGRPAPRSGDRR